MKGTIVQVPVSSELLHKLDELSSQRGQSRAALIRQACESYLHQLETRRKEKTYVAGYRKCREGLAVAATQASLVAESLPDEDW